MYSAAIFPTVMAVQDNALKVNRTGRFFQKLTEINGKDFSHVKNNNTSDCS
jgi:hypothetical protein